MRAAVLAVACALALGACAEDSKAPTTAGGDANRGRQVYLAQCVACHHSDPSKVGPLGPPVKGSSRELLEVRIVGGTYPPGYKPKRDSAIMQPMPHLASAVPDLAAVLK
ncbi:MAG: cytochrome c [Candidatus Rokubacteria bacterium]|nr:cytochrome c [Candidatus Rokubacteria bacterium]